MIDTITKKERVFTSLLKRTVITTHTGTPDESVDIHNFTIFVSDKEPEKELAAALFMQFPSILTIEIIRFNQFGTIYERAAK